MAEYEVVLNGFQVGGEMLTVLHYQGPTLDAGDAQTLADLIRGDMVDNLQGQLVSSAGYSGITIREDIPGSVGVTYPFTLGNLVGTGVGTDVYPQGTCLVRKFCDSTSRPNQGRVYQGGLSVSALEATGRWNGTVTSALNAFWTDMLTHNIGTGVTLLMVVKASKPLNPNTVPYNPVARMQAVGIPSTQRRRKENVGS